MFNTTTIIIIVVIVVVAVASRGFPLALFGQDVHGKNHVRASLRPEHCVVAGDESGCYEGY